MFNDLVKKIRIGKTGEAYLLNAEGLFQSERRSGGNLMHKDPDVMGIPPSHAGIKTFMEKGSGGDEYLYATTWLNNKRWRLVVRQKKADAFRSLRAVAYIIVLITIIGGGAIVGIAFILTGRIVRRMERLDNEREQLDSRLIRASRLAELGEMATGFAHEINNPLQIMKSEHALMDAIFSELKETGDLRPSESLSEIEELLGQFDLQINRCAAITQSILKFGRQSEPVVEDIELQEFIPEITHMVEKKAAVHGIVLKQTVSEHTPSVHGDRGQLQQVLLNLYNNVMDAILARYGAQGGILVVGVRGKEDGKVEIFVRDNGNGISQENLKKIFSPFFTTKPVGKGTGLGLSVCYGIIDKMGGIMEVRSEKGEGTTFNVILAAAKQAPIT